METLNATNEKLENDLKKTLQSELTAKQKNMALDERLQLAERQMKEYHFRNHAEAQNYRSQITQNSQQLEHDRMYSQATEEALRTEINRLKEDNEQIQVIRQAIFSYHLRLERKVSTDGSVAAVGRCCQG